MLAEGGSPLGVATVTIVELDQTVETAADGRFNLTAPAGEYTLRAESEGYGAQERKVTLGAGSAAAVEFALSSDSDLAEVVVVVGSRTPRTRTETTVPVDVVTAEEMRHVGASETGRILSTLAPSFISVPQTIADGSDHVDPASLRGLGPDQVTGCRAPAAASTYRPMVLAIRR